MLTPHDLPQWSPMKVLPYLSPWPTFDHDARPFWCSLLIKRLMSLWRCRNKHWQDGKKQVFKAFDLQKNVVTRKCCLQVTICIEDKLFPETRNTILARKLSCVKGCNTGFNEAHPSCLSSCMTMVFCFFWWGRGSRVIQNNALIKHFKIQWLYLYYSFNISWTNHSIDYENIFKIP